METTKFVKVKKIWEVGYRYKEECFVEDFTNDLSEALDWQKGSDGPDYSEAGKQHGTERIVCKLVEENCDWGDLPEELEEIIIRESGKDKDTFWEDMENRDLENGENALSACLEEHTGHIYVFDEARGLIHLCKIIEEGV